MGVGSKTTCEFASLDFSATSGTPAGDALGVRAGGDLLRGVTGMDIPQCPVCRTGRLHRSTRLTAGLVAVFRLGHLLAPARGASPVLDGCPAHLWSKSPSLGPRLQIQSPPLTGSGQASR
jgi:hypothetical protein